VHNNIIENDRISTGKIAAIIRVVAPVQSGSQKMGRRSKKFEAAPPAVQSGSVPPYSHVVKNRRKVLVPCACVPVQPCIKKKSPHS